MHDTFSYFQSSSPLTIVWVAPSSTKNGMYYHISVRQHTFLQLLFDAGDEDGDEETRHSSAHHLAVSTPEISNNGA